MVTVGFMLSNSLANTWYAIFMSWKSFNILVRDKSKISKIQACFKIVAWVIMPCLTKELSYKFDSFSLPNLSNFVGLLLLAANKWQNFWFKYNTALKHDLIKLNLLREYSLLIIFLPQKLTFLMVNQTSNYWLKKFLWWKLNGWF